MGDFQGEEWKHLKAITGCRNTGGFLFIQTQQSSSRASNQAPISASPPALF